MLRDPIDRPLNLDTDCPRGLQSASNQALMPRMAPMEAATSNPSSSLLFPPDRQIPLCEPWLTDSCAEVVRAQVLSGWIGPGRACQDFEGELASWAGTAHALLTVSGTAALSLSALALGLRPGDEILVPAYG